MSGPADELSSCSDRNEDLQCTAGRRSTAFSRSVRRGTAFAQSPLFDLLEFTLVDLRIPAWYREGGVRLIASHSAERPDGEATFGFARLNADVDGFGEPRMTSSTPGWDTSIGRNRCLALGVMSSSREVRCETSFPSTNATLSIPADCGMPARRRRPEQRASGVAGRRDAEHAAAARSRKARAAIPRGEFGLCDPRSSQRPARRIWCA
jgi:hypothetical protein